MKMSFDKKRNKKIPDGVSQDRNNTNFPNDRIGILSWCSIKLAEIMMMGAFRQK